MSNNDQMVACPLCKGTKFSPYSPRNKCKTCNGAGEISNSTAEALARIRLNIADRMKAKGIEI